MLQWKKIKSGEHSGWWCVSWQGLGCYGINKSDAVRNLLMILERSKRSTFISAVKHSLIT